MAFYILFVGGVFYSKSEITKSSTTLDTTTLGINNSISSINTNILSTTVEIGSLDDTQVMEDTTAVSIVNSISTEIKGPTTSSTANSISTEITRPTTSSTVYSISTDIKNIKRKLMSPDCRLPGVLYRGTKNTTITGRVCQRWANQSPHQHNYDVFSLAQENYCRNFDREEPWCFTNDPDVRWELCGVDICVSVTPCLNQSFYSSDVFKQCYSDTLNSGQQVDCKFISNFGLCLKKEVEISSGSRCSDVKLRSILLETQSKVEKLTGTSISECVKSPCTDPYYADAVRLIGYAMTCSEFPFTDLPTDIPIDTLCRIAVGISHCVLSRVTNETDSTCLAKDKIYIANNFMNLIPEPFRTRINFCIKNNFTEFPPPDVVENVIQDSAISQTLLFVLAGFGSLFLIAVILAISLSRMRAMLLKKRRKELLRLPTIPKTEMYESTFVSSDGPKFDPNYEVIEEIEEGYECLPGPKEESTTQNFSEERDSSTVEEPYCVPNNAEGSYIDAVCVKSDIIDYMNVHPYVDLVDIAVDYMPTVDDQHVFQSKNQESQKDVETIKASVEENQIMNDFQESKI